MELSIRPGDLGSADSEKRNLDLGQRLAALGIGDDAANVRCEKGGGRGKRAEKDQGNEVKKGKNKGRRARTVSSDDRVRCHEASAPGDQQAKLPQDPRLLHFPDAQPGKCQTDDEMVEAVSGLFQRQEGCAKGEGTGNRKLMLRLLVVVTWF